MSGFRLSPGVRPRRYELRFDLDLEGWRFAGHEVCELTIDRPTRELVLHARDIELRNVRVSAGDGAQAASSAFDDATETVRLRTDDELRPGPVRLELDVAGEIRADLKGLYRSTRADERYALTQLWPADARRLFACFDEPPFKARFALELVTDPGLTAIANARVIDRRDTDGRTVRRFAETPPISPYLLAFAVGPFEGTDVVLTRAGVPVRVWVPRGLAKDAEYARDAHRDAIDLLVDYTGMPYPYDKAEGIGVADFPAGAMENPGAVTYRLELVAAAPGKASARALKAAVGVGAHELTHQWWGNLVTLAWWDDLWLSESFASFIGNKVEDALHPEWGMWRDFVIGATRGFGLDALASAHAIHADAEDAAAALQRVDAITYQKGAAVLRMLETYLGEDAFQEGVRIYLRKFEGSTATASDFWNALGEASGQDVSRIASAWITRPGHPLVEMRETNGRLELRQRRFFADPGLAGTGETWPVPLVLRSPEGETRVLLDRERAVVDAPKGAWLHPNSRAAGFYRARLEGALRDRLVGHLTETSAEERVYLLDNEWALLQAGVAEASEHVALLRRLAGERDRAVLAVALEQIQWLAVNALRPAVEGNFARLVAAVYGPVLDRLGLEPRPGDDADAQELRGAAVRAMGEFAASADVRRDAMARIRAHFDGRAQSPDLVGPLAAVAAIDGDVALQERYVARIRGNDPQEIQRFRSALPLFRDDAATQATIARVDDRTLRDQDLPGVFFFGFRVVAQRRTWWRAFVERYDGRIARLEGFVRNSILGTLQFLTPPDLAGEADAFLARLDAPESAEVVQRTREALRLQSTAASRIADGLEAALRR